MPVQVRTNNNTLPLVRNGVPYYRHGTIAQNGARAAALLQNTVMAFNSTTLQWTPWVNVAGANGTDKPMGIYIGDDIAAADLVAGNIADCQFLVGGAAIEIDESLLVYDLDTLTRDSIITALTMTGECFMRLLGFFMADTVDITEHEN